jgi:hypothetical protein
MVAISNAEPIGFVDLGRRPAGEGGIRRKRNCAE